MLVLAIPFAAAEPLKLTAVFIFGRGHWMAGFVTMLAAYAVSIFVVEKLFRIVKPKLLKLPWFETLWNGFTIIRHDAIGWLRTRWVNWVKLCGDYGRRRERQFRQVLINSQRNIAYSETLTFMSFAQSILRRIPEPSVRLYVTLSVCTAFVVAVFAIFDGA